MAATLEELRDLSRRSRRAQRWGFLALLAALLLYPAQVLASQWLDATLVAVAGLALAALPFVRYAYLAGEERGAFRRVFRRLADERRTRTLVPEDATAKPAAPALVAQE
ncbi:MAG TPA: hypothetical protein VFH78_12625 [Candidatus Thermoplasmatota archaeon]|nr:hypothetical protein [Candidatus Thermoplasmatota archaeon]